MGRGNVCVTGDYEGLYYIDNGHIHVYQSYLDGIKKCLLNRLPSIGCYAGAWTSGFIKREDLVV